MAGGDCNIGSLRLPFSFEPARLKRDLGRVSPEEWVSHYNASDYEGDWSGAALRSADGSARQLYADPNHSSFLDTPLLERCSYFRRVLTALRFPLRSVRLLRLRAGSIIREHSDPGLSYEDGEVRLHIPIQTGPDVRFYLDGRRIVLNEGETWYLNLSRPHRVQNLGATDRVHLVVDGVANDWVHSVFSAAREAPANRTTALREVSGFDRFRDAVFRDVDLQNRLMHTPDRIAFIALTLELGRERGFEFTEDDVDAAIRAGKRAWIERWVTA